MDALANFEFLDLSGIHINSGSSLKFKEFSNIVIEPMPDWLTDRLADCLENYYKSPCSTQVVMTMQLQQ